MRVVQEWSLGKLAALGVVGRVLGEGAVCLGLEVIIREQILRGVRGDVSVHVLCECACVV